jgi:hypothetical protein
VLLNGADVFGMMSDKSEGKGDILSGTVVPLASQITTLIIVLTIILLPMVK